MIYPSPRRHTPEEMAVIEERAAQARKSPYWQFPAITPMQAQARAQQEAAMREAAKGSRS